MGRRACPTPQELAAFHVGDLQDAVLAEIAEHMETCAECQTVVITLDGIRDPVLEQLRGLNQAGSPDTPRPAPPDEDDRRLRRLLGRLLEPHPEAASASSLAPTDFTFLAPPRDIGEIGWLGAYRVLRLLGCGGMGIVFLAEDSQLRRPVALKVLRPELAPNTESRQRFLREARATAALHSEHIVTIHHVGQEKDIPFLVMELLEGQSLEDWLRAGHRPTPIEVARLGWQVAEGLAAAHDAGLVHRDIKPANLWLETSAGSGARTAEPSGSSAFRVPHSALAKVKILDFGLARGGEETGRLTRSGFILGTPAYMAPEQARDLPLDSRCDLFSLGCVLYHLLAGETPFRGGTAMAVLTALAVDEPAPLSLVNPSVPLGLADLVNRLLAKDPVQRPASARAVAAELKTIEECLTATASPTIGTTVSHPAPDTNAPAEATISAGATRVIRMPLPRRRRHLVIGILVGAVLAVAGASFFLAGRGRQVGPSEPGDAHVVAPTDRLVPPPADPDEAWLQTVIALPIKEREERVKTRLKERNPDFNGEMSIVRNDSNEAIAIEFRMTALKDLSALRAFPSLGSLSLTNLQAGLDLHTIRRLHLNGLDLRGTPISDLRPLIGMRLGSLELTGTLVRDLRPLDGMPLGIVFLNGTPVSDLSPLAGSRLAHLNCVGTQVRDLGPLRGLPLSILNCGNSPIESLLPVQDLRVLRHLNCDHTQVRDLTPLAGLELRSVSCTDTKVSSLEPLRNMPSLRALHCSETRVRSLAPLAGTGLTDLSCAATAVEDLTPVAQLPLTKLDCHDTLVSSLAPLRGLKLTELNIQQTKATDLSPLLGLPLEVLTADIDPKRDADLLRSLRRLRVLNGQPVEQPGK